MAEVTGSAATDIVRSELGKYPCHSTQCREGMASLMGLSWFVYLHRYTDGSIGAMDRSFWVGPQDGLVSAESRLVEHLVDRGA